MTLFAFLAMLRQRALLVAGVALAGLIVAAITHVLLPVHYEASSRIFVTAQSASSGADLSQGDTYAQQVARSFADVTSSEYVLQSAASQAHYEGGPAKLARAVTASAQTGSPLITVTVSDKSPLHAARLANEVAAAVVANGAKLSPQTEDGSSPIRLTVVQRATVPTTPAGPSLLLVLVLGIVVGLVAGIAAAALRESLDNYMRTADSVSNAFHVALFGTTPYDPDPNTRAPLDPNAHTPYVESYRTIGANLDFAVFESSRRLIAITSSLPAEGKTTTTTNLAVTLARGGRKVLLVDADMRRPKVHAYLGLDGTVGLSDVLASRIAFSEAVQDWGSVGLTVLPAGASPPNPLDLLQSSAFRTFVERAGTRFDFVLFDTPPLLAVADAAVIGAACDGTLLVVALAQVRSNEARRAIDRLTNSGSRLIGIVTTALSAKTMRRSDIHSYSYDY